MFKRYRDYGKRLRRDVRTFEESGVLTSTVREIIDREKNANRGCGTSRILGPDYHPAWMAGTGLAMLLMGTPLAIQYSTYHRYDVAVPMGFVVGLGIVLFIAGLVWEFKKSRKKTECDRPTNVRPVNTFEQRARSQVGVDARKRANVDARNRADVNLLLV